MIARLATPISLSFLGLVGLLARPAGADLFVDRAVESGIDFHYFNGMSGEYYFPEILGGGAALFDYDNDGDLDAYLVQGAMLGFGKTPADALIPPRGPLQDRLYRNDSVLRPDGTIQLRFTERTQSSGFHAVGYGVGVATGDCDNDGWTDLYVTNVGSNMLLRNNQDGTFTEVERVGGADDPGWSVPAAFVDFDRDGLVDLFVGNYLQYTIEADKECRTIAGARDYCGPLSYPATSDRLWRNSGDCTFEEVSERAGLLGDSGHALGVVAGDLNGDRWPDIYVANDGVPNQMWINQGDGTFINDALLSGTAVNMMGRPEAGMGVTAADYDADGDLDLFLTHLDRETNTLYRNDGNGFFEDATVAVGLASASWSSTGFGTAWLDYDNDGWLDLITANGAVHINDERVTGDSIFPMDQPNKLFRNLADGRFEDVTAVGGSVFELSEVSRGMAIGDVDNDGDADVLLTNNSGPARLLFNNTGQDRRWVGLSLGVTPSAGTEIGTKVGIRRPDRAMVWRQTTVGGSWASASDPRVVIGLGDAQERGDVEIVWPNGRKTRLPLRLGYYMTSIGRAPLP